MNMKSPAMSPPRKYPILNKDINRFIPKQYPSLPPVISKYLPVYKPLLKILVIQIVHKMALIIIQIIHVMRKKIL